MNTILNDEVNKHLNSFFSSFQRLTKKFPEKHKLSILNSFEMFLKNSQFINEDYENIDYLNENKTLIETQSNEKISCDSKKLFYNYYEEEIKLLRNQISVLEIDKNILVSKLKLQEQECHRVDELVEQHEKLLRQVDKINRHIDASKGFRGVKKVDTIMQTDLTSQEDKGIQSAFIGKRIDVLPYNIFFAIIERKSFNVVTHFENLRNKLKKEGPRALKNIVQPNKMLTSFNKQEVNINSRSLMMSGEEQIDLLADRLKETKLPSGVSFAGKGLKLDTAADAKQVVDAINNCGSVEFLNLEGNTIGVEAAVAISKALESQQGLKRALWKDMFTGRLKEEIPKALKALCRGVMRAQAQLEILDLSDNASGPIGVNGIAEFLKSPSCYTLKELRLNNMGLGITGAQMLSNALLECCRKSEEAGTPLKLKVFIAGRNRLEDEGVKALSQVFKKMESLEELSIPQNSIYTIGIKELADSLSYNLSLKKLNLNDNTLRSGGAKALESGLHNVRDLRILDLGDCLIKTKGASAIANLLASKRNIEVVDLSYNSIKTGGAVKVLKSLKSKPNLTSIKLDGNKFGEEGIQIVKSKAAEIGIENALDTLDEDEGSEDDDDDNDHDYDHGNDNDDKVNDNDDDEDEVEDEDDDEDDDEYDDDDDSESLYNENEEYMYEGEEISPEEEKLEKDLDFLVDKKPEATTINNKEEILASEFIANPSIENLKSLGKNAADKIIEEVKKKSDDITVQIEELIVVIMSVSSLLKTVETETRKDIKFLDDHKLTLECSDNLYGELFALASQCNCLSTVNNTLPVFLGLIKGEYKKPKSFDQRSSITILKEAMKKDYFPKETSEMLRFLLSERLVTIIGSKEVKQSCNLNIIY